MYSLYFLQKRRPRWRIMASGGGYIDGNLKQVAHFLTTYWGFKTEEIDKALDKMVENDHDGAHFGVTRNFLYSFENERDQQDKGKHGLH